jgi:ABC-type branched-subunit amino acid transport system substrate-binding protein
MGRIVAVVSFAALVAIVTIFAKPLWQGALTNEGSQTSQAAKPSDRLTANNAPVNNALVPATTIAAAPVTPPAATSVGQSSASGQRASLSPQDPLSTVRGVTDSEIRFGISAALSGPTKELGQNMQRGIVAAFNVANANGGVHGRQLRLIAADDGYEPTRTAVTMKQLYERDQVFGVVGNVGTPTAVVGLPYALERKMLFFGAFTGAGLLRNDPPDRYVFNYRASYAEETSAVVHYLVKVKRLKMEQIAVFAQQDPYGDSASRA